MPGTLILCATPIGNLGDVSERLGETLATADLILAEDTRRTSQLLRHLGLSTPMKSFFIGNERARLDDLGRELLAGHVVALVSDAGMPVVRDPGASAVRLAIEVGAVVSAVPGPSAVTMAIAVSGFDGDRFVFEGFLPKKGRERSRAIEGIRTDERTLVLFASPKRVAKDLGDLVSSLGPDRDVVVCRELTKLHEEIWHGSLDDAHREFSDPQRQRGEFTVVVSGATPPVGSVDDAVAAALGAITEGATTSDAVRAASARFGVSRREVYDRVVRAKS